MAKKRILDSVEILRADYKTKPLSFKEEVKKALARPNAKRDLENGYIVYPPSRGCTVWDRALNEFAKGLDIDDIKEVEIMIFRSVCEHSDPDFIYYGSKSKPVRQLFLHVVLQGSAVIEVRKTGTRKFIPYSVKTGDVFLLDPASTHRVSSTSLCVTFCAMVPKAQFS